MNRKGYRQTLEERDIRFAIYGMENQTIKENICRFIMLKL